MGQPFIAMVTTENYIMERSLQRAALLGQNVSGTQLSMVTLLPQNVKLFSPQTLTDEPVNISHAPSSWQQS